MTREQAEALIRLAASGDGRKYLEDLAKDFDNAMKQLLAASNSDELLVQQGVCKALSMQLKKFDDARRAIEGT